MHALSAARLGKAYRTYRRPADSLKELLRGRDYGHTFWALRDISFDVARGDSLGIVGDNGAGKTTLLRLLAGATVPTEGQLQRHGRMGAILTLGAGFHPDLSGLDNLRIGCALAGLSTDETERVLPRILDFSELGSFIDRPARTYSSGMHLRLGFSLATAVDPDVLIVDEHLAVGDQHFRHKCMRRIMELQQKGCSLVFCSHDLHSVGEVCQRTLWIRDGRLAMSGPTGDVLKVYQDHVRAMNVDGAMATIRPDAPPQELKASRLLEVTLGGDCRHGSIETGGRLELRVLATLDDAHARDGAHIGVLIVRNDGVWCYGVSSGAEQASSSVVPLGPGTYGLTFIVDALPLLSGQYTFTVALLDHRSPHVFDTWSGAAPFTVRHSQKDVGLFRLEHRWGKP